MKMCTGLNLLHNFGYSLTSIWYPCDLKKKKKSDCKDPHDLSNLWMEAHQIQLPDVLILKLSNK